MTKSSIVHENGYAKRLISLIVSVCVIFCISKIYNKIKISSFNKEISIKQGISYVKEELIFLSSKEVNFSDKLYEFDVTGTIEQEFRLADSLKDDKGQSISLKGSESIRNIGWLFSDDVVCSSGNVSFINNFDDDDGNTSAISNNRK